MISEQTDSIAHHHISKLDGIGIEDWIECRRAC